MDLIPIGFLEFGIRDLVETLIIATVLFLLYRWIRGSFAVPAFVGIIIVFAVNAMVSVLGLTTISFVMHRILDVGILAVIIIFQPEIRKLLYNIGRNTSFDSLFNRGERVSVVDEVIEAVKTLARNKTGALLVFTPTGKLNNMIQEGIHIDATVTSKLLVTIFNRETPLHDGAVLISGDRILSAGCFLPISENPNISSVFGTRHRAAVGVSESNNVFVLVVSEETGRISVAKNGNLTSGLTIQKLREEMEKYFDTGASAVDDDEDVAFKQSEKKS